MSEIVTTPHAIIAVKSNNKKFTGGKYNVATTYASIVATCPKDCMLRKTAECYGLYGHVGLVTNRLDKEMTASDGLKVIREEVFAINLAFGGREVPQDGFDGGRDLRLHTAGDCKNNTMARTLSKAADKWKQRGGGRVWTYTHAWEKIKRSSWGRNISVLASLDDPKDAKKALQRHYMPAKYVAEFPGKSAYMENGINWIPCRAQVRDEVSCATCRLCMNDAMFKKSKTGIAFQAHGSKMNQMKKRLNNE